MAILLIINGNIAPDSPSTTQEEAIVKFIIPQYQKLYMISTASKKRTTFCSSKREKYLI